MNKLTGKALEDFYNYYYDNYLFNEGSILRHKCLSRIDTIVENALIIEFFDNVKLWEDVFYKEYRATGFKDYKKALTQAIIKANEIYNNK